jgi:Uma2 family endonuclease
MVALSKKKWTVEEYFELVQTREERYEFVSGEIYMMSGASEEHNLIVANLIFALRAQLRGRSCKVYPSDMQVHIAAFGDYHYPDVSVVCGQAEIVHSKHDMLLNPSLIIEVLSPSTEQYDRGKKFENYRTLESLQEYLLIAQNRAYIERYVRHEAGWLFTETKGLEAVLKLTSLGCTLALSEVYELVDFEEANP